MKKVISILLLSALMLIMLVSCNQGVVVPAIVTPEQSTEDTGVPTLTSTPAPTLTQTLIPVPTSVNFDEFNIPEKLKGLDFEGEEIGIIMSGSDVACRSISMCLHGDGSVNAVDVAVMMRNNMVEQLLGVEIVLKETVMTQGMVSHLREYFASPDTSYDIVGAYQYFDLGLAYAESMSGAFYDYGEIEEDKMNMDLKAEYWDSECYEALAFGGDSYWITGDLSLTWLSTMYVSYVNAEIWAEYEEKIKNLTGCDGSIYDLVYDGKWTLDLWLELNELVHKSNDGNEAMVTFEDQHGFLGYDTDTNINNIIVDALVSGCHVTFSEMNEEGIPSIKYDTSALEFYSDKTNKLYESSKSCLFHFKHKDMDIMEVFKMGNSLMTVNTLAAAEKYLGDMKDSYYVLPLPKANSDQGEYSTSVGDSTNHFGIPKKCQNLGAVTATLEALGLLSYQIVTPVYYNIVLKGAFEKQDIDAIKMIEYIRGGIYTDFVRVFTGYLTDDVNWYMRRNIGNKTIVSEAPVKEQTWGRQLRFIFTEL